MPPKKQKELMLKSKTVFAHLFLCFIFSKEAPV